MMEVICSGHLQSGRIAEDIRARTIPGSRFSFNSMAYVQIFTISSSGSVLRTRRIVQTPGPFLTKLRVTRHGPWDDRFLGGRRKPEVLRNKDQAAEAAEAAEAA
jgi:hypothetical protein